MADEYVRIAFLRTKQDFIFKERLDYYRRCYQRGDALPPIEVMPFGDLDNLLIINGNHRARAQQELGILEIPVNVLRPNYRMGGIVKTVEELQILPGDRTKTKEGFQLPKWTW